MHVQLYTCMAAWQISAVVPMGDSKLKEHGASDVKGWHTHVYTESLKALMALLQQQYLLGA
jgi:hypothetical protein